jgi:hypothetical protein
MNQTIRLTVTLVALVAMPLVVSAAPRDWTDYRFRTEARREARQAIREARRSIREAHREMWGATRWAESLGIREGRRVAREANREAREAMREARRAASEARRLRWRDWH